MAALDQQPLQRPADDGPFAKVVAQQMQQQHHQQPQPAAPRPRRGLRRLLLCCVAAGDDACDAAPARALSPACSGGCSPAHAAVQLQVFPHHDAGSPGGAGGGGAWRLPLSPRKHRPCLKPGSSAAHSDADWHDAASTFSSAASSEIGAGDALVRELGSFKAAPWVPDPPLAFGTPDMQFVPVPAVTGFAAYWLRDDARTTPFPQPIDLMLKAPYLVKKTHASIPGIWIQETPTGLTITATPAFVPPMLGISGYVEEYDKSNATEPSWFPRRDLKMGRAWGKLYLTADNCLVARVWQRPAFSDKVDIIMEEYMTLEEGGSVIVDKMTCLHCETGKRAEQFLVGFRRDAPPGH